MSGQLGDLVVSLSADISRFQSDMGKATKEAQTSAASMGKALGGVESAIGGIGKAFALVTGALAGGAMFKDMIDTTKEVGSEVLKLQRSMGLSAGEASILRVALDDVFVSADDMAAAAGKLTKTVGTNEDAFKALGVATRDSNGHFRSTTEIMTDTNSKLSGLKEGINQNSAGLKIYGKGWEDARKTIKLTAEAMVEGKGRAEELHLVLTDGQLKDIKNYKLAMKDLGDVAEAVSTQTGLFLMPELTKMAKFFADKGASGIDPFINGLHSVGAEIIRLGMLADKVGGSMTQMAMLLFIPGTMAGNENSTKQYDNLTKINKDFEQRYKEKEKMMQTMANLEVGLDANGNRIEASASGGKGGKDVDPDAAKKIAELEAAQKAAAALRKEWDTLKISLADETYAQSLTGLDKELAEIGKKADLLRNKKGSGMAKEEIDAWQAQAENAKIQLDYQAKIQKELDYQAQAYEDTTKIVEDLEAATMSKDEKAIKGIEKQYELLDNQAHLMMLLGKITEEQEAKYHQLFGVRMQEDIQNANNKADGMAKVFEEVAKGIHNSFVGFFESIFDGGINSISKLADGIKGIFKKIFAEMAAMAIARPIIVPIVSGIGSAMGISSTAMAATQKQMGMDTGGLNNAATGFSLASAWNAGTASGTLQGMSVGGLSGVSSMAYNVGLDSAGDIAFEGANYLNSLSSGLADGLTAGVVSLAISLLTGKGLTVQTGMQAAGSALGATLGGPIGAVLGGLAGNFIGGLFGGDKENQFTLGELVPSVTAEFDKTAGMRATNWQHPEGGNGWYAPIADAYSKTIGQLQTNFNAQVFQLTDKLPQDMQTQILDNLAVTDFSAMLSSASGGRWGVSDAQGAIEGIAKNFATALASSLGNAYATALGDYVSSQGAAGLVGDSAVWSVLTEKVQNNINDMFSGAADTIKGGDVEGGLTTINNVTAAIAQIGQAMAPINEILATNGLSDYEKNLRSLNQQFDGYAAALKAAGVDLAKYTALEKARMLAIQSLVTSAGTAYLNGLIAERDKLQGTVDTARTRYLDLLTKEHDALGSLKTTLVSSIDSIRKARADLYTQAGALLPGAQQLNVIKAEIERQRSVVTGDDPAKAADALTQIQALSTEYLAVSKGQTTDWREYARSLAYIDDLLNVSEASAVTMRDDSQAQIDRLDSLTAAVNGSTETALTIDQARTAYEESIRVLDESGIQAQIDSLTELGILSDTATRIETLLSDFVATQLALFASLKASGDTATDLQNATLLNSLSTVTAGNKEQWVASGSTNVWGSTGGAYGVDSGAGVEIFGKTGADLGTATAVTDWVSAQIAANDPMAVYSAAVAQGVSSSSLEQLMGWTPGTANAWADTQNLQHFATGGSFTVGGGGGDNLTLPGLRVSAGEMVSVSRPDVMAGMKEEIRLLRQEVTRLLQEGNKISVANVKHSEKTASVLARAGYEGLPVQVVPA